MTDVCWCCGERAREYHHILPKRAGGKNDRQNIMPLCTMCHNAIDRIPLKNWPIDEYNKGMAGISSTIYGKRAMLKLYSMIHERETK